MYKSPCTDGQYNCMFLYVYYRWKLIWESSHLGVNVEQNFRHAFNFDWPVWKSAWGRNRINVGGSWASLLKNNNTTLTLRYIELLFPFSLFLFIYSLNWMNLQSYWEGVQHQSLFSLCILFCFHSFWLFPTDEIVVFAQRERPDSKGFVSIICVASFCCCCRWDHFLRLKRRTWWMHSIS